MFAVRQKLLGGDIVIVDDLTGVSVAQQDGVEQIVVNAEMIEDHVGCQIKLVQQDVAYSLHDRGIDRWKFIGVREEPHVGTQATLDRLDGAANQFGDRVLADAYATDDRYAHGPVPFMWSPRRYGIR